MIIWPTVNAPSHRRPAVESVSAALELIGVSKSFGPVAANRNISLTVARGSIHAIVGENGAGKSTLLSILSGARRADAGEIRVDGKRVNFVCPRDALDAGIGMVHQHFMLIEAMSVIDNILLGAEGGAWIARGRTAMKARLALLAPDYGMHVDPDARIADLPVGVRQRVEILKALTRDVKILALDEPTAVLTPDEANDLFALMRQLRDGGTSILFITHKLREVMAACDRVSVMRRGEIVAEFDTAETSAEAIAEAMVGRRVKLARRVQRKPGGIVLSARDVKIVDPAHGTRLAGASLELRAGEIVGIAGVSGNGQTELLEALAGMRQMQAGSLWLDGVEIAPSQRNPRAMRALGVMHAPEDRARHGLVLDFPARESAMLGFQGDARYGGRFFDTHAIDATCAREMAQWNVQPARPDLVTRAFSGGNQQKIVLARELDRDPRVLLIGQPTRGVDIGAIESIHARLLALRDAGKAILLVSSELDEILALSDRILVMCGGRIVGERRSEETDASELGLMMAGASEALT